MTVINSTPEHVTLRELMEETPYDPYDAIENQYRMLLNLASGINTPVMAESQNIPNEEENYSPRRTLWNTRDEGVKDAMGRNIHPGDILTWRSGGYFGHYQSFGIVIEVTPIPNRKIRVRNHNYNIINIWNTFNTIIVARRGDYSDIPESWQIKLGVEDF